MALVAHSTGELGEDHGIIAQFSGAGLVPGTAMLFPRGSPPPAGYLWVYPPPGYDLVFPWTWSWPQSPLVWPHLGGGLPQGYVYEPPDPVAAGVFLAVARQVRAADKDAAAQAQAAMPPEEKAAQQASWDARGAQQAADKQKAADQVKADARASLLRLAQLLKPAIEALLTRGINPLNDDELRTARQFGRDVRDMRDKVVAGFKNWDPRFDGQPAYVQQRVDWEQTYFPRYYAGVDFGVALSLWLAGYAQLNYQIDASGTGAINTEWDAAFQAGVGIPTDDEGALQWRLDQAGGIGNTTRPAYEDGRKLNRHSPELQLYLNQGWGWLEFEGRAVMGIRTFPDRLSAIKSVGVDLTHPAESFSAKFGNYSGGDKSGGGGIFGMVGGIFSAHSASVAQGTEALVPEMLDARKEWCHASGLLDPAEVKLRKWLGLGLLAAGAVAAALLIAHLVRGKE